MLSRAIRSCLAAGTLLAVQPALPTAVALAQGAAATPAAGRETLEEIVVTAQKRAQSLEQVPVAVNVLDADDVVERGITDFAGLVDEVPGVSINYAFGGPQYGLLSIRGIGGADDYKPNGNPSVALHVDGVYQTSNAYLAKPLFDLERVEVLKGPQGTLYGRNTTAGVVNAITRGPGDETNGYADLQVRRFDYVKVEGALGGPVSDTIGLRLAVLVERGGGFMDGRGAGTLAGFQPTIAGVRQLQVPAIADPGPRDGFGDEDVLAARGTLTWQLTERTDLTVKAFGSRDRGDTRQYDRLERALDNTIFNAGEDSDPYVFYSNQYYEHAIDVAGLTAELVHGFASDLTLTLLAGTQASDRRVGGNGDGTPYPQFEYLFEEDLQQASFEARLANADDARLRWIGGLFWIDDETEFDSTWTSLSVRSIYVSPYVQERRSAAVFGQVEYDLAPQWRVAAGARYTRDEASFVGRNDDLNPWRISTFAQSFATTNGFAWDRDFEDDDVSGRVSLQWLPTSSLNLFVSGGTGYRGGGFDGTSIFTLDETFPFESERVRAAEAGLRWTQGRVRLAVDAFADRFRDLQATTRLANDTNGRTNVGRAKSDGAELALTVGLLDTPSQRLEFNVGAAWLDTEITEFRSARVADVRATVGDPLPGAPDVTANASLRHSLTFGNGWGVSSRLAVAHHGEETNRLNALPNNTVEPYTLLDARVEVAAPQGWAVYAYGRNLTDEVYFPELNGAARLVGEPRTYGLGVRWRF